MRTLALLMLACGTVAAAQAPRRLRVDDLNAFRTVGAPQCSPGGRYVAYAVTSIDVKADAHRTHIWTARFDGSRERQVTFSNSSESAPAWSPDGRYLSFLSARPGPAKGRQVWVMNRRGGEAHQLTSVAGGVGSYAWSPDGRQLALVIQQPKPKRKPGAPPLPLVITRYKFKEDTIGFLDNRKRFIYVYDLATKKLRRLTEGDYNETSPSWSPHGRRIAFLSNHDPHPERELHGQLYVIAVQPGARERALTTRTDYAENTKPAWSPDGRWIAFLEGAANRWGEYTMQRLAEVAADGSGAARVVDAAYNRGLAAPRFTRDGSAIEAVAADDRSVYPIRMTLAGKVSMAADPPAFITAISVAGRCRAGLVGHTGRPTEVYALDGAQPRPLSHQNDALMRRLKVANVEPVSFPSADGTRIDGLLMRPVGYAKGRRVPLLLRIHGGPDGQNSYSFDLEDQMFAAHGYAVLNVNYRGSSGRGEAFQRAIFADWGDKEVQDLMAGVKWAIANGIADPHRLGVGGWSYGAILTDYMIASDSPNEPQFKAAIAGAGTGFAPAFYGVDEYIIQYNYEIGPPWTAKGWATFQKISYPFLHANRIHTPTLFMGGTLDANVPLEGGEQMYEALRTLHVPAELVVYPGQYHGFTRPSFLRDRLRRYLAWYGKYLGQ
jgi:dipeptidyl aminopeptidase/acylaminoacyl peptidase